MGIDNTQINFSQDNLLLLNISIGFIMFGVALNLTVADFRRLFLNPRPALVGVLSQFIILPLITFLLVLLIQPAASIALGMIMVAACPGGNISNFMSVLGKGNVALSVTLTAFSTILAVFLTPFNLSFYGSMYGPANEILTEVEMSYFAVFKTIVTIFGIPIVLGMLFRHYFTSTAIKVEKMMKVLSILIFAGIIVLAFRANLEIFYEYIHLVIYIVFFHNAIALITGYQLGRVFNLPSPDKKTLAIETGIQNTALGLLLIFSFFNGLGGMALVAAWWGIWHIFSGLSLAFIWNYQQNKAITI